MYGDGLKLSDLIGILNQDFRCLHDITSRALSRFLTENHSDKKVKKNPLKWWIGSRFIFG